MAHKIYLAIFVISVIFIGFSYGAHAQEIILEIKSLTNVSGSGAMEACGIATHSQGKRPLLVTIKHDESYYSTLTALNGQWCLLVKRWTFDGKIEASATTLDGEERSKLLKFKLEDVK
jgi:hypothetical protein